MMSGDGSDLATIVYINIMAYYYYYQYYYYYY
jgi:hypothetical protein